MSVGKRVTLTIKQRMDVLKDLETASVQQVAALYNVNRKTIQRIRRKAASIIQIGENKDLRKRKRMKEPLFPELERQLYSWFVERRTLGDKLSDALLLQKARELQGSLESKSICKLSTGWLIKFKRRNNIRLIHPFQEELNADEVAAHSFTSEFKKQIQEEQIDLECIYNMDETGLFWKALPSKTLESNEEACVSGQKEKKERVCIALCANATGTHKLMPFFIHKFEKPRTLRNGTNRLPVIYASQKNTWMDQQLFMDWLSHFKESVQLFQLEKGICSKVILLIHNFEAHKLPFNYIDDNYIEIKYLPQNTTSLIQPMDQVIRKTKRCFRHKLMKHVATYAGGTTEFYKNYSIKDCIHMLANAWADITSNNIKNSWHKFLLHARIHGGIGTGGEEEDEETSMVQEMQEIMSQISLHNVTTEDITDFLTACNEKERRCLREGEVRIEYRNEDWKKNSNEDKNENGNEGWNENNDECTNENRVQDGRDKEAAVRLQTSGIPLSAQERQHLENVFTNLEWYDDRVTPAMRMLVQSIKLSYLGENLHDRKEIDE